MEINNEIRKFDVGECEYRVKLANGEEFVHNVKGSLIIAPRFFNRFNPCVDEGKDTFLENSHIVQKASEIANRIFVNNDVLKIKDLEIKTSNIVSFEPIIRKPLIKRLLVTKVVVKEKSWFSKRYITKIKYERLEDIKDD